MNTQPCFPSSNLWGWHSGLQLSAQGGNVHQEGHSGCLRRESQSASKVVSPIYLFLCHAFWHNPPFPLSLNTGWQFLVAQQWLCRRGRQFFKYGWVLWKLIRLANSPYPPSPPPSLVKAITLHRVYRAICLCIVCACTLYLILATSLNGYDSCRFVEFIKWYVGK